MITLTYWELGLVVSAGMFFISVVGLVAQVLGADDAMRSIVSRLRRRLQARGFQSPEREV